MNAGPAPATVVPGIGGNAPVAAATQQAPDPRRIAAFELMRQRKREFRVFLDSEIPGVGRYSDIIAAMVRREETRLIVELGHLRQWDGQFTRRLLQDPQHYIPGMEEALNEFIRDSLPADLMPPAANAPGESRKQRAVPRYRIGFEGSFGSNLVSPRHLAARHLHQLVCVEGIVTRCGQVRPRLVHSAHYCAALKQLFYHEYADPTSFDPDAPTAPTQPYPTRTADNQPLQTEYGLCVFRDHQKLVLQEMPERAPPGLLPRSVEVLVEGELVDRVKPGDRVRVAGVYRPLPRTVNSSSSSRDASSSAGGGRSGNTQAQFRAVLVASHLQPLLARDLGTLLTDADIAAIRMVCGQPRLFERMAASLAPSIYGHTYIKQALLLQLLSGLEHNLATGTHLRGDINILLVGDPSTAKSQLLRFVLHIAPLAISTNGRGASGVGLTAAVVSDKDTGERRLEAGAMVLADRGVVCIDEFDKMSEDDRVAIHEVMEQQTVTVNKAGIHATLNARCSVLAAANPVYGRYNRTKRPHENIALPDSLLSRFDLLFIVLDHVSAERDRQLAEHVLRMHRHDAAAMNTVGANGNTGVDGGSGGGNNNSNSGSAVMGGGLAAEVNALAAAADNASTTVAPAVQIYAPFDPNLAARPAELFAVPFVRKYLLYARLMCHPHLTDAATTHLTEAYAALRAKGDVRTLPVTPRLLETLIRLATAHARCYLRSEVTLEDAQSALRIAHFALYQDPSAPNTAAVDAEMTDSTGNESQHQQPPQRKRDDGTDAEGSELDDEQEEQRRVESALVRLRRSAGGRPVPLRTLVDDLQRSRPDRVLSADALERVLKRLHAAGKLLYQADRQQISFL